MLPIKFYIFFIGAGNIGTLMGIATGHTLQAFFAAKAGPKRLFATVSRKGNLVTSK
jgi:hypothetical protein